MIKALVAVNVSLAQRTEIDNGIWSSRAALVFGRSAAHSHFAGAVLAPLTDAPGERRGNAQLEDE
jgi:hypothetical protein